MKAILQLFLFFPILCICQSQNTNISLLLNEAKVLERNGDYYLSLEVEFCNNSDKAIILCKDYYYYPAIDQQYAFNVKYINEKETCNYFSNVVEQSVMEPYRIENNFVITVHPKSSIKHKFQNIYLPKNAICSESTISTELQVIYDVVIPKPYSSEDLDTALLDYLYQGKLESNRINVIK